MDKIKQGIEQSRPDVRVDGSIASAFNEVRSVSGALAGGKAAGDIVGVEAHSGTDQYIKDKAGVALSKETTEAVAAQSFDKEDIMKKKAQAVLDSASLTTQKDKQNMLETMINEGILEEGSTVDNLKPVTGARARKAWAAAKAGAMESDERLMIGDDRVNISQNLKTGQARANIDGTTVNKQGSKGELVNTETGDYIQIEAADALGEDSDSAVAGKKAVDAAKYAMDPRNDIASVTGVIAQTTGLDPDTAGYVGAALGAGGISAIIANKFTKEYIPMSKEQLEKLTPVEDANGNLKGYENTKGKMVADKEGFILDGKGKRIESGMFGRKFRSAMNGLKSELKSGAKKTSEFLTDSFVFGDTGSNTFDNPFDNPTDNTNNPTSNDNDTHPEQKTKSGGNHHNLLNSDAQSITNNAQNGKTSVESASKKVEALGDAVEVVEGMKPQDVARN